MDEFLTDRQIADDLIQSIDQDQLEMIKETSYQSLCQYHNGLGRYIRNTYGMWDSKNPYSELKPEPNEAGIIDDVMFPDQRSLVVIQLIWEYLNK